MVISILKNKTENIQVPCRKISAVTLSLLMYMHKFICVCVYTCYVVTNPCYDVDQSALKEASLEENRTITPSSVHVFSHRETEIHER